MGRVFSRITAADYFQENNLGDQLVEGFVEDILAEAVTKVGKSAVGWAIEKVEATEEVEAGIIAQSRSKLSI